MENENVAPNEDLRAAALAEMSGTNDIAEDTAQNQESEPEVAPPEEETQQVESPEPKPEDKTKKLYKALGKKDKRIAELEALIAEKSTGYDATSLELINAIARKQALESESESREDAERETFMDTLPQSIRESLEEDLEQNPQAWRIVQKTLSSVEAPKPRSKTGITGNS